MFQFIVASGNNGKIREIREMLGDLGQVLSQKEANILLEPEEWGATFRENALIKAKSVFNALPGNLYSVFVIADDSGICVDALNGEPGVKSARYASTTHRNAQDSANRCKLIIELEKRGVASSKAQFVTCMALVGVGSRGEYVEYVANGVCEGEVINHERGHNGFGYDSMFIPDGFSQTLAELLSEVKNSLSHRYKALQQIRDRLAHA